MIALLASELLRARSRRFVKILAIMACLAVALAGVLAQINSDPAQPFGYGAVLEVISGVSFIIVIVGWYMGASLVGAEWAAGTLATLITWESRRSRVLAAKSIAAFVTIFVFMTAVCVALAAVLSLVASAQPGEAHPGFLGHLIWLILRISSVSALAGLLGFSVATIARHTARAVGIGFGYLGIVEGLLRAWRPGWQRLLLGENIAFWILGGGSTENGQGMTLSGAGLVLAGYGAILLSVALVWFRARDVN